MKYQIYNPKQIPKKDGGEYINTALSITQKEADIAIERTIAAAKETCKNKGWKYSDMVHKNELNIVG